MPPAPAICHMACRQLQQRPLLQVTTWHYSRHGFKIRGNTTILSNHAACRPPAICLDSTPAVCRWPRLTYAMYHRVPSCRHSNVTECALVVAAASCATRLCSNTHCLPCRRPRKQWHWMPACPAEGPSSPPTQCLGAVPCVPARTPHSKKPRTLTKDLVKANRYPSTGQYCNRMVGDYGTDGAQHTRLAMPTGAEDMH
jgi:hypothetical protein